MSKPYTAQELKYRRFKLHNEADINGTFLVRDFDTFRYKHVVQALGPPPDGLMWRFCNRAGEVFTLYSTEPVNIDEYSQNINLHIGGKTNPIKLIVWLMRKIGLRDDKTIKWRY